MVGGGYSEPKIRAEREGSRQKAEMQRKIPSFVVVVVSLVVRFENFADLLGCGCGYGVDDVVVVVAVEVEGPAVVEGDSDIPLKLVNLARAVATA